MLVRKGFRCDLYWFLKKMKSYPQKEDGGSWWRTFQAEQSKTKAQRVKQLQYLSPWSLSGPTQRNSSPFLCVLVATWWSIIAELSAKELMLSKLCYWRRLLRVLWTVRTSDQSILKEINPEYSLEGLMLKFQYFGHLIRRVDSLEKTLMLGKIEGRRRRGWQKMTGWMTSMDMSLSKLREIVKDREAWRGVVKSRTGLSDWTTTTSGWALPLSAIEMSVLWPHPVTRGRL